MSNLLALAIGGISLLASPVVYTLEVGEKYLRGGVFLDGLTTQTAALPTPRSVGDPGRNRQLVFEGLCQLVDDVAARYAPMDAVGISVAGTLRLSECPGAERSGPFSDQELYLWSPYIEGLNNLALLEWLDGAGWEMPVHVENDANAALLSATTFPSALSINMSGGIGAAVKRDGRIEHIGNSWSCYEIGHGSRWLLPEELVTKCVCGSIMGCLEAAIGSFGLCSRYGVRPEDAPPHIYERMRHEVVRYLAPAIADTARDFELSTVLLSGSAAWRFAEGFDFVGALEAEIRSSRPELPVPFIKLIQFGATAGLHGVALALIDSGVLATTDH